VSPGRIVFTSAALDSDGKPMIEAINTVTLEKRGGKTTLTLHARVTRVTDEALPYLAGMEAGWTQTLEGLAKLVAAA
jgi:uncharacterized protein YndB with AHSA1/START domain